VFQERGQRPDARWFFIAPTLAFAACRPSPRAAPLPEPPAGEAWLRPDEVAQAGIVVAPVEEHDIDEVLVTNGRVTFDEARVAHVLSPLSGRVARIVADLGAPVRKGEALALLESPDLGGATADLNKATADLIAAEHAFERQKELRQANATSEAALEQADDLRRTATAERDRAGQKVALLHGGRTVSQLYAVTSHIDGTVLARNVTPGLNLQGAYSGGSSPELFTVGDIDTVWVLADVYETDLARVHEGAHVGVSATGVDQAVEGTVDWVSAMLDPQTRTAHLRCVVRNAGDAGARLKPEMYVTVRVSVTPSRALAIAGEAIVHMGPQALVFVDRGTSPDGRQRFERVPIVADETAAGPTAVDEDGGGPRRWVPVTHGLKDGERIIVTGGAALLTKL
jgi:membrane fusion protein, heavy metal efflux system